MCEAFSSGKFKPLLAVWAACLVDFRPSSNHRPSSRSPTVERTDEHRRRVPEASARVSSVGEARTRTADEEACVIELRSAAALALASAFFGVGWNVGLTRPVRKALQGAGVLEISDHHALNAVLIRDENIASKIATPAPDGRTSRWLMSSSVCSPRQRRTRHHIIIIIGIRLRYSKSSSSGNRNAGMVVCVLQKAGISKAPAVENLVWLPVGLI